MSTKPSKQRIEIIDALRGFSLAGIVIVHFVENFVGSAVPENAMTATHMGIPDTMVDVFIGLFLRGKFFALFSFLFGLSFFIQMDNAQKQGKDFGLRFFWRLIILLVIGMVHHMFYRGDILTIYALLGIFLIPFYKLSNKWVLACVGVLFLGLGRYVVFAMTHGENILSPGGIMPEDPQTLSYFNILKNGSLQEVFISNSTMGHLNKLEYQLGIFGRGYLTFGYFLLGLVVGRTGFFLKLRENKKWIKKALIGSIVLFVVSLVLTALIFIQLGQDVTFDTWPAIAGLTAFDLNNIAMTFILIILFVMLYNKANGQQWLAKFAPYGRMALTNYFLQSVLGTFLFFGWGMGYLGEVRNSYIFLLAIAIIAVQMQLSTWWLIKFQYGPFEWLWRSITFFKWYPLQKKAKVDA